jgi:hypothetical protein
MAWTTPATFVSGAVLTAAQMNAISANLNETAPAKVGGAGGIIVPSGVNAISSRSVAEDIIDATGTTTSTTYVDIGPGPTVAITTGAKALVIISAFVQNNTSGQAVACAIDISGASTIPASDGRAIRFNANAASDYGRHSAVTLETGLTGGLNSFVMKYRVSGGTGTFANRRVAVIPLS